MASASSVRSSTNNNPGIESKVSRPQSATKATPRSPMAPADDRVRPRNRRPHAQRNVRVGHRRHVVLRHLRQHVDGDVHSALLVGNGINMTRSENILLPRHIHACALRRSEPCQWSGATTNEPPLISNRARPHPAGARRRWGSNRSGATRASIESMKINERGKQMHPEGGVWRDETSQRSTTPGVPRFMVRVRTNSTVLDVHSVRMQFGSWVVWLGTCMGGDSTPCGAKVACHSGVFSSCATTSAIAAREWFAAARVAPC